MTKKERPVFRISPKDMFCLPSISGAHGCGPWLVRGTRCPAGRICCLFTISNIRASHTQEGRREPHDKIHPRMDTGYTNTTKESWWSLSGSNRRPEACKATALPAELRPRSRSQQPRTARSASPTGRPRPCAEKPRQRTWPPAPEASQ